MRVATWGMRQGAKKVDTIDTRYNRQDGGMYKELDQKQVIAGQEQRVKAGARNYDRWIQ